MTHGPCRNQQQDRLGMQAVVCRTPVPEWNRTLAMWGGGWGESTGNADYTHSESWFEWLIPFSPWRCPAPQNMISHWITPSNNIWTLDKSPENIWLEIDLNHKPWAQLPIFISPYQTDIVFLLMSQKYCSKPCLYVKVKYTALPGGTSKEPACQCRRCKRCGFGPWVRKIPWRSAWQPSSVCLPGESHGQRSLAGYSPWGHAELTPLKRLSMHVWLYVIIIYIYIYMYIYTHTHTHTSVCVCVCEGLGPISEILILLV